MTGLVFYAALGLRAALSQACKALDATLDRGRSWNDRKTGWSMWNVYGDGDHLTAILLRPEGDYRAVTSEFLDEIKRALGADWIRVGIIQLGSKEKLQFTVTWKMPPGVSL